MPLTKPQTVLHWRTWSACVEVNCWEMVSGRLSADAQRTREASLYHTVLWRVAEQLALQGHRSVTAEDLRHASYLVATTKVPGWGASCKPMSSMRDLGNREFSRWLVLIALLINPDDLGATMKWEHPEDSAREGLVASLRKSAPEATLRAISARAFDTREWETLSAGQLAWLRRTVGEKQRKWSKPVEAHPF
jgi:hypothetical protein